MKITERQINGSCFRLLLNLMHENCSKFIKKKVGSGCMIFPLLKLVSSLDNALDRLWHVFSSWHTGCWCQIIRFNGLTKKVEVTLRIKQRQWDNTKPYTTHVHILLFLCFPCDKNLFFLMIVNGSKGTGEGARLWCDGAVLLLMVLKRNYCKNLSHTFLFEQVTNWENIMEHLALENALS